MISKIYKKDINIVPDDSLRIDRSLNSDRFRKDFGYEPPNWNRLLLNMYEKHFHDKEE